MVKMDKNVQRVFALYAEVPDDDPIVFVGQSRMKDLKKLFNYLRRENKKAAEFFETGITPHLFLLEDAYMPEDVAYKYRIAWTRYFLELDYDVIAYTKPYEDALDLYGLAEDIYKKIAQIPIEMVLQRMHVPVKELPVEERDTVRPERLTKRLSIRLTDSENKAFLDLCQANNLTQREAIQLLLANINKGMEVTTKVIQYQDRQIHRLKDENAKLKKVPRSVSAHKNLNEAFSFAKKGMIRYGYSLYEGRDLPGEKLGCVSWKDFVYVFPDHPEYSYPKEDSYFYFRVEALCYGKGTYSAVFLYGSNCETGERVKIRFYPRPDYCGMNPAKSEFFRRGMCFFVGCRRIYPNVAELVLAFPMFEYAMAEQEEKDGSNLVASVASTIESAKKRSGNYR